MCTSHEPCQIFLALELSYGLWTLIPAPAIVKDTNSEGTLTNMQVQPNRTSSNLCQAPLTSSLRLFGWQDNLTPIHAEPRSVWEPISHDTYLWLVEDRRQWMNSSPFFLPPLLLPQTVRRNNLLHSLSNSFVISELPQQDTKYTHQISKN